MNIASTELPVGEHEPSEPPDERALFSRLAAFMARHRRSVIVTWLVVAFAAAPLALTLSGALSGAGWEAQGSTAQLVRDELRRDFASLGAENPDRRVPPAHRRSRRIRVASARSSRSCSTCPATKLVVDPLAMPAEAGLISRDGRTALIPVAQAVSSDAERPIAAGELGSYVGRVVARVRRAGEGHR